MADSNNEEQSFLENFYAALASGNAPESPYQGGAPAAVAAPPSNVFGEGNPPAPVPMGGYDANPFALPEMRRQESGYEDPGSKLMRAALGQAGEKMGGDYFRSGGTEWGQPTTDANGREQGPRGGMSQLDPSKTTDIGRSDVDMSGINPTFRQYAMSGDAMVTKPLRDFNDLGSMPSGSAPIRDAAGEYVLDANGRRTYYDQPGIDFRNRIASRMNPTTLENGQQVAYDPTNNTTWSMRDGQPGQLLAGGLGMDSATRQQANYYGWNPTTTRDGRPVYYDEASNRTFERNRDGSAGRQIMDVNRDARYLDGGRVGGGSGAPSVRPNTPPVTPPATPPVNAPVIPPPTGGQLISRSEDGQVAIVRANGQDWQANWDGTKWVTNPVPMSAQPYGPTAPVAPALTAAPQQPQAPDNTQYFTAPGWEPTPAPPRYNPDYFTNGGR